MRGLDGAAAVVTGGAGPNIGSATSEALADAGAHVVVLDVDEDAGERIVDRIEDDGGTASFVHCDVCDPAELSETIDAIAAELGTVDVLVNNAGGAAGLTIEEIDPETFDQNVDVNLKSAFFATRAALPHLRDGGGSVVFVSTINACLGGFSEVAYAAANAGLHSLAETLTADHAGDGVRFNVVAPGSVVGDSETWQRREADSPGMLDRLADLYPVGRYGEPDDVADAVTFLASERAEWISGVTLPVDGGLAATGGLPGGTWWDSI